jgi:antirestriction protein ArdC
MSYRKSYSHRGGQHRGPSKQERVRQITEQLEQGITDLFTSENYKKYLHTMGKFRRYSFNNTVLIAMQKPDATLVAGYMAWQKNFHRNVKKGEKGITIFAPIRVKEKKKLIGTDGKPVIDANGKEKYEETGKVTVHYTIAKVFDVSQTEGEPLPSVGVDELYGKVPEYDHFMDAMMQISPVPVSFEEIPGGAKGYFSPKEKKICIQAGMSEMHTMKTCVHEMTHAKLHDIDHIKQEGGTFSRETAEVEAESVAYVVCEYFGLDTSEYSFPYIAGWSSSQEMKELKASMDKIRMTADGMVGDICKVLYPDRVKSHGDKENYLRTAEDMLEQNDNSFDGILNNLPASSLPEERVNDTARDEQGSGERPSLFARLQDGKEQSSHKEDRLEHRERTEREAISLE